MTDIVERLREWSECNIFPEQAQFVISEAVCEITALRADNEKLRAALLAISVMDISWVGDAFKLKDIARAALGEKQ